MIHTYNNKTQTVHQTTYLAAEVAVSHIELDKTMAGRQCHLPQVSRVPG